MKQYDRRILNSLLDSYESSTIFHGSNKKNIRISFPFVKKKLPEYFDESSTAYEEIHASLRQLEEKGYVQIVWKKGKEGHIVEKVLLCVEAISDIYPFLERTPKAQQIRKTCELLQRLEKQYETPVASALTKELLERIRAGKSVKEYIDLADMSATERLVKAISAIEQNRRDCYVREFSIAQFSDSKTLEGMLPVIAKAFRRFAPRFSGWDSYDILAEYSIYHTPNFVYFKGEGQVEINGQVINLGGFGQGLGVSGQDLCGMKLAGTSSVRSIITIENLTTFFRWREPESILIYLGGYLNGVRRDFLKSLYSQIPQASYRHFGDIDVGGFEIYENLCAKTGIPFETLHMDLYTLKKYQQYARPLTEHDRSRLENLRQKNEHAPYREVLDYMMEEGIKLEQECVVRDIT